MSSARKFPIKFIKIRFMIIKIPQSYFGLQIYSDEFQ